MIDLKAFSIKIRNYKCFSEVEQGFEKILPINLIIGRNNSGKSTLLELIEYSISEQLNISQVLWHNQKQPEIIYESPLVETEVKNVFNEKIRSNAIPGRNDWAYGQAFIGTRLKWRNRHNINDEDKFVSLEDCPKARIPLDSIANNQNFKARLAKAKNNPLSNRIFKRISAERDIVAEQDGTDINVASNGSGTTNIIQNVINKANLPSDLVERRLLTEINKIFEPDSLFTDIVCQQIENGKWEIHLEEESKGRVPLSHTGSGLKTILMVLVFLHLIPLSEKRPLGHYVFAFEELENNLHPALQRRLLNYLYKTATDNNCLFFLTTHSNVAIDLFNKNPDAQIVHLTHDGEMGYSKTVRTYIENKGI